MKRSTASWPLILLAGLWFFAAIFLLAGCAGTASVTPPLPPVRVVSALLNVESSEFVAPTEPKFIELTWDENYVAGLTNEETEIDESTDLVNWVTCFTGATNECWIQEIYPFAFYRASNFLP